MKQILQLKSLFKMKKLEKNVEPRTWDQFRKTGLFMFVNTILHAFGWALVVEVENYKDLGDDAPVTKCYPARVKFRGFSEDDQTEMHKKIANYLEQVSPNLKEEIK